MNFNPGDYGEQVDILLDQREFNDSLRRELNRSSRNIVSDSNLANLLWERKKSFRQYDDLLYFLSTEIVSPNLRYNLDQELKTRLLAKQQLAKPLALESIPIFLDQSDPVLDALDFFDLHYRPIMADIHVDMVRAHDPDFVATYEEECKKQRLDFSQALQSRDAYMQSARQLLCASIGISPDTPKATEVLQAVAWIGELVTSPARNSWAGRVRRPDQPGNATSTSARIDLPKVAPARWIERTPRQGETEADFKQRRLKERPPGSKLPDFLKLHYSQYMRSDGTGITRPDILDLDEQLYAALSTWLMKNDLPSVDYPDIYIPSKSEANDLKLKEVSSGRREPPNDYQERTRLNMVAHRRRKAGIDKKL